MNNIKSIVMETSAPSRSKTIHLTTIQFPEIPLKTRDAHKLRGYFGNIFKEHSPLLHNHYENGEFRHRYPLVQYKIIKNVPTLVAMEEGAELLMQLFLKIKLLEVDGKTYEVHSKNIVSQKQVIGYSDELREYRFATLWMALNQENYKKFRGANEQEKESMLNKVLVGNVLSFFKQMGHFLAPSERLLAKAIMQAKSTQFKNQTMMAFSGSFLINADLPNLIGLGKSVSRGFGTISGSAAHAMTPSRGMNKNPTKPR